MKEFGKSLVVAAVLMFAANGASAVTIDVGVDCTIDPSTVECAITNNTGIDLSGFGFDANSLYRRGATSLQLPSGFSEIGFIGDAHYIWLYNSSGVPVTDGETTSFVLVNNTVVDWSSKPLVPVELQAYDDTIFHSRVATSTLLLPELFPPVVVPAPAAIWLFGSGLFGLIGITRKKKLLKSIRILSDGPSGPFSVYAVCPLRGKLSLRGSSVEVRSWPI